MPPPSATDSWLAGRRFGIVIDAGSSGSRLQIYSWRDPRIVQSEDEVTRNSLPKVEKGTREGEDWVSKVEPGISSFADDTEGIATYLAPLLEHARSNIPPSLQAETPIFLLATAGMRLLAPEEQAQVLQGACHFLKFHSNFRIDDPSDSGPCGSSVRIITGEEEGLFGWIAVNYLMDGFTPRNEDHTTYGFLDMGGASTQIAFEPKTEDRENADNLIDVRLRLIGGKEIHHEVFVTTWLGYGTNQARERYVAQAINGFEGSTFEPPGDSASTEGELIPDPCLPKDLQLTEQPVHTGPSTSHTRKPHALLGTGSFEKCLQQTSPLLNKDVSCIRPPCLMNGVHVPPIDFSASHFIGVSEYWYSSEQIFGLGGAYDFVQYERAASEFCAQDWVHILTQHERSKEGEEQDQWTDQVEIPRLQMQCFKAAWIVNMLHEGIGMPRIVDPGGNDTTRGSKVAEQAAVKGLGKPMFQSVDTVGDVAISWTLGKMVLEASKEVPPLPTTGGPLVDPLESSNSTIRPIRPPFLGIDFDTIEDKLSDHIPIALTRASLGFSPIGFAFYIILISAVLLVIYRLRHHVLASMRRYLRGPFKKDRNISAEAYLMEEGKSLNGKGNGALMSSPSPRSSRPPSPTTASRNGWLFNFRRLLSRSSRSRPAATYTGQGSLLRHAQASPSRISPIRSFSMPAMALANGNGKPSYHVHDGSGSAAHLSRAASPSSPSYHDETFYANGNVSSLYSRSRNSSQMSLSTLVPRQTLSKSSSTLHLPNGGSFRDE